ncbi:hypothetical protein K474DRAFT_1610351, partial [Panus rudis PR-1116 ss-1]
MNSSDDDNGGGDSGDEPPSSPSNSSSSSDSDSSKSEKDRRNHRKKHKQRKKEKKALEKFKPREPFKWDGTPDLDLFDTWTFEVDTYRELTGLSDRIVLKMMVNFMTGKPRSFFMKHVATHQKEWNTKLLYEALFDYCFPEDFKSELRDNLMSAKQDKQRVRDFVRDLENLAERFPDVTQRQIIGIFWKGIHQYLRLYLIDKGFSPETTKLKRLVKYAARHEKAH